MKTPKAPKRLTEYYRAIDEMEGALYGCEGIKWEELDRLYGHVNPGAVLRPNITVGQMMRVKRALDKLNEIVNR